MRQSKVSIFDRTPQKSNTNLKFNISYHICKISKHIPIQYIRYVSRVSHHPFCIKSTTAGGFESNYQTLSNQVTQHIFVHWKDLPNLPDAWWGLGIHRSIPDGDLLWWCSTFQNHKKSQGNPEIWVRKKHGIQIGQYGIQIGYDVTFQQSQVGWKISAEKLYRMEPGNGNCTVQKSCPLRNSGKNSGD